ncbi:hypothetical protein [Leifsonia poae]|uniref:Uncharacterized protein n=1 Tax=Leifsonia poae TaxID=110933 RepID=A0A9W6HBW8_9MICO|nr:hypothetical protein [Leifsonia poae]GLJ76943.1 hypothetical protein GCM10017584_25170 [Leifsonia poae]
MSAFDEQAGDERENLEGTYTETDGEGPVERTVHGQYTETEEFAGPETETEGSYVDSDGVEETLASDEQGEYTETDYSKSDDDPA